VDDWKYKSARDLHLPLDQRLRSHHRESGLIDSLAQRGWWGLVRTYLALAHRLSIEGLQNVPAEPPFILVANHTSHLDALILAACLPRNQRGKVFPIAAGDTFFETKLATAFAALLLNALPMWRKKCGPHAMEELRERLVGEPCSYILFPEGTRSRDGKLGRFKAGLGMLIAETPVAVVPCYIAGAHAALPPDQKWPRPTKVSVRIGPSLSFASVANARAGWEEITKAVEEGVKRLAPPIHSEDSAR
jgi:1-acyl-sn-glycerol-3-phosphate acyltransferase